MLEDYIIETRDMTRVRKLNMLHNPDTFWDDVRRLTKNVHSDHSISRWQILAEVRYGELCQARRCFYED